MSFGRKLTRKARAGCFRLTALGETRRRCRVQDKDAGRTEPVTKPSTRASANQLASCAVPVAGEGEDGGARFRLVWAVNTKTLGWSTPGAAVESAAGHESGL